MPTGAMHEQLETPIDVFRATQADLRAVERFARSDVSGRTERWSELIPLSAPARGEQYRFEVDLDSCSGCKSCVTACHSLNGLDEFESFRSIGLLLTSESVTIDQTSAGCEAKEHAAAPAEQTVTTACHHCVEPGCLIGCPAEAYEKDPVTGIVRHLDDACIGCQYCTLTCPYDVPVFNERLGIVRKCDMCSDRLAGGEAPACVQGCPTQAISISVVALDDALLAVTEPILPGAAPSHLTQPTTLYRGSTEFTPTTAADATSVSPAHAHLPLVAMLVLSQWALGIMVATTLFAATLDDPPVVTSLVVATIVLASSAAASFFHLGQPLKAWRVALGWRHSWLSREAIVIGVFLSGATGAALLAMIGASRNSTAIAVTLATFLGIVAVGCSAMIYVATGRWWWRARETGTRFAGTALISAASWIVLHQTITDGRASVGLLAAIAVGLTVEAKLAVERSVHAVAASDAGHDDARRTASLLRGALRAPGRRRTTSARIGVALLLIAAVIHLFDAPAAAATAAVIATPFLCTGEWFERRLFFQACAPATMPGAHR